jgi:hypothetical protein
MKLVFVIIMLALALLPVTAQSQSCEEAVSQALPLLAGAKSLLEAGNTQDAAALIQSAEAILTACQPGSEQSSAATAADEITPSPTVALDVVEATPEPTVPGTVAAPAEALGEYVLNPPELDTSQGIAFVTFVHTSADAGPLDLYYGNQETPVVSGLTYGTFTGLMPIQAGSRTFRARAAGSGPSGEVLYRLTWDFLANSTWMVTAAGVRSTFSFIVEPITIIRNAYDGQARVRVINVVATGPRVTVTDGSGKIFGDGLGWVGIKDSLVAPGEYILSASTQTGLALAQPAAFTFEANHTYTLFVIGDGSAAPLAFLNLPVEQDITRVRFMNTRGDRVDVHARPGNARIVEGIEPGAEGDWIELPSGAFTFIAYAPDTGPTGRELAGIALQLRPQRDVVITIGDSAMQLQSTELRSP